MYLRHTKVKKNNNNLQVQKSLVVVEQYLPLRISL